jgi:hypothetical protein
MNAVLNSLYLLAVISSLALTQGPDWSTRGTHATLHSKDSFVLVFGKQSIQRGPDYSTRASALDYQKRKHIRDLVWFFTADGCFMSDDPGVIAGLKETEEPQEALGKRQARVGGSDLELAHQLAQEQNQLTWQRDEIVWALFDKLRKEGRLKAVSEHCPSR